MKTCQAGSVCSSAVPEEPKGLALPGPRLLHANRTFVAIWQRQASGEAASEEKQALK